MLLNDKQRQFLELRVKEGKSLDRISKEIDVSMETLREWVVTLMDQIEEMKIAEIDLINEMHDLAYVPRLRYLGALYTRLRKELDNRDFSGLPTDKLFSIMSIVRQQIDLQIQKNEMDDYDDYDDFDDMNWDDMD